MSEKVFNQTFYRSHYPSGMIACRLCFIWQPSFVKNYSTCCSRHFVYVFSIDSNHALKISLNHCDQNEVSPLKDFSENPYTFSYFCHQTAIYSFSDWFICFDFSHFCYNKDFFAFRNLFSTSYIARGIIKLIAWTTSYLDFEITWLIWNSNNSTMSPPWPKNINLYLKRILLIQNAWRMNLT